jgi:hypothetical protein
MNHSVIVCVTLMVVAAVLAVEDQPELEMAEEIVGFDELSAARVARGVDQLSKGVFTRNTNFLLDDTNFLSYNSIFVVLLIFCRATQICRTTKNSVGRHKLCVLCKQALSCAEALPSLTILNSKM